MAENDPSAHSGHGARMLFIAAGVALVAAVAAVAITVLYLGGAARRDAKGEMWQAVEAGDVARVRALVDEQPALVRAVSDGATPIAIAAALVEVDMVELFIARGADVNRPAERDLMTGLHYVASGWEKPERRRAVVRLLAEAGADVNARARWGDAPLSVAASCASTGVAAELIRRGARVNAKNDRGNTPLHTVAMVDERGFARSVEFSRVLLGAGANVHAIGVANVTPLHLAAGAGNGPVTALLVRSGAGLNVADADGETPLHHAARKGTMDSLKVLVESGADINPRTKEGKTPLGLADKRGDEKAKRYLEAHGAMY